MKKYTKIAFFYRTKEQYEKAQEYVRTLSDEAVQKFGVRPRAIFAPDYITLKSNAHGISQIRNKIPKERPGKKKYTATIGFNTRLYDKFAADRDMRAELVAVTGVELISNKSCEPKLNAEDVTEAFVRLKNQKHFGKLVSLMNAEYGHGNWQLRNAKKILAKLRDAEHVATSSFAGDNRGLAKEINEKGLRVKVVVTSKVDNLDRLLFKLQLMT